MGVVKSGKVKQYPVYADSRSTTGTFNSTCLYRICNDEQRSRVQRQHYCRSFWTNLKNSDKSNAYA